jgi:uncharacterized membrane protein YuzA (DUF378 family)
MSTETAPTANDSINTVVYLLVGIAALNWGLVGAFDFNLVNEIVVSQLGAQQDTLDIVYMAIGGLAAYDIYETLADM